MFPRLIWKIHNVLPTRKLVAGNISLTRLYSAAMLNRVRTNHLDFDAAHTSVLSQLPPQVPNDCQRIYSVGDDGRTKRQILGGEGMSGIVAGRPWLRDNP